MRTMVLAAAMFVACGLSGTARAQNAPTVVQLPTFHFFSSSTTVSVPDSGGATLGGVVGSRSGSASRGGPLSRSRGQGGATAAANVSVHATIIDNAALDRAVLARAKEQSTAASPSKSLTNAKADFLSSHVGGRQPTLRQSTDDSSVAAHQRHEQQVIDQRTSEAAAHFAKAEQLLAAGKPAVAKIYFEMAARRDRGSIRASAERRLAQLSATNRTVAVRD